MFKGPTPTTITRVTGSTSKGIEIMALTEMEMGIESTMIPEIMMTDSLSLTTTEVTDQLEVL